MLVQQGVQRPPDDHTVVNNQDTLQMRQISLFWLIVAARQPTRNTALTVR
jgi:hypothetical protein